MVRRDTIRGDISFLYLGQGPHAESTHLRHSIEIHFILFISMLITANVYRGSIKMKLSFFFVRKIINKTFGITSFLKLLFNTFHLRLGK